MSKDGPRAERVKRLNFVQEGWTNGALNQCFKVVPSSTIFGERVVLFRILLPIDVLVELQQNLTYGSGSALAKVHWMQTWQMNRTVCIPQNTNIVECTYLPITMCSEYLNWLTATTIP